MLLALALLGAVIMWARGTNDTSPIPCISNCVQRSAGKAVPGSLTLNRATPMYSNPAYVGGADRAAMGMGMGGGMGRHDSSV